MDRIVHIGKEGQHSSGRSPVRGSTGRDGGTAGITHFTHTVRSIPKQNIQKGRRIGGRIHDHIVRGQLRVAGNGRLSSEAMQAVRKSRRESDGVEKGQPC